MSIYEIDTRPMHLSSGASMRFQLLSSRKRLQEDNHFGSNIVRRQTAIWLHVVAWHHPIGIFDEAIKFCSVPDEVLVLHGAGIAIVRQRADLSSKNLVQIWP